MIPNGCYGIAHSIPENPLPDNYFIFTQRNIRDSYGWVIDGDIAEQWVSGSCDYKAKIVEKDGEIYFEGYEWFDFLYSLTSCSSKYEGNSDVYQVEYNERVGSISLALVAVPNGE